MLKLNRSLSTSKSTTKINTIETQLHQPSKKRSFSLRKLNRPKQFINKSPDFNKISTQLPKQLGSDKILKQVEQQLLKTESLNSSPRKSKYKSFNLSKLSPIKQYQTKLKISAESWLVFDYRKDSYKRGWKPADIAQFSGLARLLVFKAYIQLEKINPDLKNFNMRVNTNYLKEEVEMRKQERMPANKKKGLILRQSISRVFDNNIVINVIDLLFGLLMTNYDDILQYAIIFMGHLCHCQSTQTNPVPEDSPCHFIDKVSEACANADYFAKYLHQDLFPKLEMSSSQFQAQSYTFRSTANDICRLYLSIQSHELFKQIISCKELNCKIKYQIGFRYWENRTMIFKNRRIDMGMFYQFVCCWKAKKNYSVLSRNIDLDVLIILQDCKYGMAECDIRNIQSWVKDLMKPVVDHRKTHAKLLPLLRNSQNSPPKILGKSIRLVTQEQQAP